MRASRVERTCKVDPLHAYAILQLGSEDQVWRKSLTNEARKGANKARASGLFTQIRVGSQAVADPFYDLYLRSMKRLGVKVPKEKMFPITRPGAPRLYEACD